MAEKPLCPKHAAQKAAWLDYRLPPPPIQILQVGRPTERRLREQQEARFREWKDTIQFHRELITGFCRDGRNCSDEIPEVL